MPPFTPLKLVEKLDGNSLYEEHPRSKSLKTFEGSGPRRTEFESERLQSATVIPISESVGLVTWLSEARTLHDLINSYRSDLNPQRPLTTELKLIREACPTYDSLFPMAKVWSESHWYIDRWSLCFLHSSKFIQMRWIRQRVKTSESCYYYRLDIILWPGEPSLAGIDED